VQERGDSVREATGEAWRRLQSLEAEVGRIGTLLDVVRDQSDAIRTGQAELKVVLVQKSSAGAARGPSTQQFRSLWFLCLFDS